MATNVCLQLTYRCTVFEINDGATLDDEKLKVLESGSHEYVVVTFAVSFELKSRDEILSLCSACIVRFSGAVGKVLSLWRRGSWFDPGQGGFFLNNAFNFHRAYTLPGFINLNLQRGKTYTWIGSTWDSKINYVYIYIYKRRDWLTDDHRRAETTGARNMKFGV